MITLSKGGAYLLNGNEVIEVGDDSEEILKSKLGQNYLTKEEAAKNTMAYNILNSHNTSRNMEKLQIKFDKLTSHDITFVGIIQTARASGLELLMKMTTCLDLHVQRNTVEFMYHLIRQ